MATLEYIASVYSKGGALLFRSQCHPTREQAAAEAFSKRPATKQCSTCIAHQGQALGRDIRWHKREA
jgi:hypothetical protein